MPRLDRLHRWRREHAGKNGAGAAAARPVLRFLAIRQADGDPAQTCRRHRRRHGGNGRLERAELGTLLPRHASGHGGPGARVSQSRRHHQMQGPGPQARGSPADPRGARTTPAAQPFNGHAWRSLRPDHPLAGRGRLQHDGPAGGGCGRHGGHRAPLRRSLRRRRCRISSSISVERWNMRARRRSSRR